MTTDKMPLFHYREVAEKALFSKKNPVEPKSSMDEFWATFDPQTILDMIERINHQEKFCQEFIWGENYPEEYKTIEEELREAKGRIVYLEKEMRDYATRWAQGALEALSGSLESGDVVREDLEPHITSLELLMKEHDQKKRKAR